MSYELRRRLVGILVLVALGLVVVPLLFDFSRDQPLDRRSQIPVAPAAPEVAIEAELRPQLLERSEPPKEVFQLGAANANSGGFVIQFASFADRASAEQQRQKLFADGYKVYLRSPLVNGERTHQVLVGPLLERAEAEALEQQLNRQYKVTTLLKALQ